VLRAGAGVSACAGPRPRPGDTKGSLVIIGGGLRANNAEVWQKIVALAGGKGARIAVLPTAAQNPEREGGMADALNALRRAGLRRAGRAAAGRHRRAQGRRRPGAGRRRAQGRRRVLHRRRPGPHHRFAAAPDGSNTAVLDALWALYRRGGVIAGTSAGAAIMSSTMFYDPPLDVLPVLKHGVVDGKDVAPGLGFIGDDVFVDQHLLARGRFARMLPAMLAKGYTLGLGIDENTAAVVGPARDVTVIGYRGALVLDLARCRHRQGAAGLQSVQRAHQLPGQRRPVQPRPRAHTRRGRTRSP
jgi:cyanophycinase